MHVELPPVPAPAPRVGEQFAGAGFELYLVGGAVRDQALGIDGHEEDMDLATDARPLDIVRIVEPMATAIWRQGERFGTIGATVDGKALEITTYRSERYLEGSRKPTVGFGEDLETDLSRRDFTINAMARDVVTGELVDPFHGIRDLEQHLLRTPLSAEISFSDDPLRMLRAARFAARLDLRFSAGVLEAAHRLSSRLAIVSGERIFAELDRLLSLPNPAPGIRFIWETGVLGAALGGVALQPFETVEATIARLASEPTVDSAVRWAVVCQLAGVDVDHLATSLRMSTSRSQDLHDLVSNDLPVDLSVPTLRRVRRRLGDELPGRIAAMRRLLDPDGRADLAPFLDRFARLIAEESMDDLRPPLTGHQVMELLGEEPGPLIGEALEHLTELAIERGPLTADAARAALRDWRPS